MLRETVLAGEFPQWNRWIGGGQPMAANPAHQVFYPPVWLILLPSFTYGFNLFLLLHLFVAAFGMYALLRSLDAGPPASAVAAVSFALSAVLAVHDFVPLLLALAWLPWTCLYARKFIKEGHRRDFVKAALLLGVQVLLGEIAVLLQTGMILGVYALDKRGRRGVGIVALLCVVAVGLAMVQFLPAADHARDSVRSRGFAFERVVSWSMPAERLLELVNPNVLGHQMLNGRAVYWGSPLYGERGLPFVRSIYPGIAMTVLAIAGIIVGVRGHKVAYIVAAISIILAFGNNTPLWGWLYQLGVARSIRYPEKFILTALFALTVLGASVLDRLLAGDEALLRMTKRVALITAAALGAIAAFSLTSLYAPLFIRMWDPSSRMIAEMLPASRSGWLLAAGRAAVLFILLRNLGRVRRPLWLALGGVVVLLDLGLLVPEIAPRMPRSYFEEMPDVAREFHARHRDCRLMHAAAWQPGGAYQTQRPTLYWTNRNAMYPLMPGSWGIATAVDRDLERTALLPTADFVETVLAMSGKDPAWLEKAARASNVCAVAVFQQPTDLERPVRLIHLPPSPRYSMRAGAVRTVTETPTTARIEVDAGASDALYMSVTPHKYWRVTIDGRPATSAVANIGFQTVPVPPGRHVVEMRYRNPLFLIGGAISLATLLLLLWRMW